MSSSAYWNTQPSPVASGPSVGRHTGGQLAPNAVQVLQHPRARPVEVGAVLEDDVDEGHAEERVPPHRPRAGHLEHLRGDRIGDLVLHDARRLLVVVGLHDDLHVAQVRQRFERGPLECRDAGEHGGRRGEQDDQAVGHGPVDEPAEHGRLLRSGGIAAVVHPGHVSHGRSVGAAGARALGTGRGPDAGGA